MAVGEEEILPQSQRPSFVPPLDLPHDSDDEEDHHEDNPVMTSVRSPRSPRPDRPDFVPPLDLEGSPKDTLHQPLTDRTHDDSDVNSSYMWSDYSTPDGLPPMYVLPELDFEERMLVLDVAEVLEVPEEYHDHFLDTIMTQLNYPEPKAKGGNVHYDLRILMNRNIHKKYYTDEELIQSEVLDLNEALMEHCTTVEKVGEHFAMLKRAMLYKRQLERRVYNLKFKNRQEYWFYKERHLVRLPRGEDCPPRTPRCKGSSLSPLCLFNYSGDSEDEEDTWENDEGMTGRNGGEGEHIPSPVTDTHHSDAGSSDQMRDKSPLPTITVKITADETKTETKKSPPPSKLPKLDLKSKKAKILSDVNEKHRLIKTDVEKIQPVSTDKPYTLPPLKKVYQKSDSRIPQPKVRVATAPGPIKATSPEPVIFRGSLDGRIHLPPIKVNQKAAASIPKPPSAPKPKVRYTGRRRSKISPTPCQTGHLPHWKI